MKREVKIFFTTSFLVNLFFTNPMSFVDKVSTGVVVITFDLYLSF